MGSASSATGSDPGTRTSSRPESITATILPGLSGRHSVSGTTACGSMPADLSASSQLRNSSRRNAATSVLPSASVAPIAKWKFSTSPANDSYMAYGTTCASLDPDLTGSSGRASVTLEPGATTTTWRSLVIGAQSASSPVATGPRRPPSAPVITQLYGFEIRRTRNWFMTLFGACRAQHRPDGGVASIAIDQTVQREFRGANTHGGHCAEPVRTFCNCLRIDELLGQRVADHRRQELLGGVATLLAVGGEQFLVELRAAGFGKGRQDGCLGGAEVDCGPRRQRRHVGANALELFARHAGQRHHLGRRRDQAVGRAERRILRHVRAVLGAFGFRHRVVVDPVRHQARPAWLRPDEHEQAPEAIDTGFVGLEFFIDEVVEIEASLHVLERTAHLAAVDRQRRQRLRPGFTEVICSTRLVLVIVLQGLDCPGLGAERDVPALVERHEPGRAAQVHRRARADPDREDRRDRDDDDGRDEGDAALPHPDTSTMRRISP